MILGGVGKAIAGAAKSMGKASARAAKSIGKVGKPKSVAVGPEGAKIPISETRISGLAKGPEVNAQAQAENSATLQRMGNAQGADQKLEALTGKPMTADQKAGTIGGGSEDSDKVKSKQAEAASDQPAARLKNPQAKEDKPESQGMENPFIQQQQSKTSEADIITRERAKVSPDKLVEFHSISAQAQAKAEQGRIARKGTPKQGIENKLNMYMDSLEPQVQKAVEALAQKGYKIEAAGFLPNNPEVQFLKGHFELSDRLQEDLLREFKVATTVNGGETVLRFVGQDANMDSIEKQWGEIAAAIPKKKAAWLEAVIKFAVMLGIAGGMEMGSQIQQLPQGQQQR